MAETNATSPQSAPSLPAHTRDTTAEGRASRTKTKVAGWASNDPTRTTPHSTHSPTDAVARQAALASCSPSAKIGPAVNGNAAHQTRTAQTHTRSPWRPIFNTSPS